MGNIEEGVCKVFEGGELKERKMTTIVKVPSDSF